MAESDWPKVYKGAIYDQMIDPFIFKNVIFPSFENKEAFEQMEDWQMRPDDVLVIGWPRTGSYMCKNLLWNIMTDGEPPEGANISDHVIYLNTSMDVIHADVSGIGPNDQGSNPLTYLDSLDSSKPRLMCAHLPYHLMPNDVKQGKVKVILQTRNVKDATVSHHLVWKDSAVWKNTDYTLGEWISDQVKGGVPYGDWIDNTISWLKHKDEMDILILQYEDVLADMAGTVAKMAKFVNKDLSPDLVQKIAEKCTFAAMKKKPDTFEHLDIVSAQYLRKGKVGDWKNHFTVAQNEEMDAALKAREAEIDAEFQYE